MNDVSIRCTSKINDRGRCGRRPPAFNYPRRDQPKPSEPAVPFTTEESYVSPMLCDWPVYDTATGKFVDALDNDTRVSMVDLTAEEAASLELITIFCDFKRQFGKRGTAPTFNYKKTSVVRAEWKPYAIKDKFPSARARAAYDWFMETHPVYQHYHALQTWHLQQRAIDPSTPKYIQTARLLLHSDGIEVAARPLLYPRSAYGDSDLRYRLLGMHLKMSQLPNMKASYLRKCLSRCASYNTDPKLLFLIYDIATCRGSMATITWAEQRGLSPECLADNRQRSEGFWRHEQGYTCDMVRQMAARCDDHDGAMVRWCGTSPG